MANNRKQDEPVLEPLRNSQLVCANCVLREENDFNVLTCSAYDLKPSKVLDGGPCPKHMTLDEAIAKYGKE